MYYTLMMELQAAGLPVLAPVLDKFDGLPG